MATLDQILSPVWTYSITGGGAIAEGLSAIRQCIDIIIRTTKGTDPLRPEFGSDVYKYQDYPLNVAIPKIKKAILDAISLWEPRVKITSIVNSLAGNSNLLFNVNYQLVSGTISESIIVTVGSNGIYTSVSAKQMTLIGYFPPNPLNFQYAVAFSLNGNVVLPQAPAMGFASLTDMYSWIQTNWSNYGQWYITANSIIGYINNQYSNGNFSISILPINRFSGGIPALPISYKYAVSINVDGTVYTNNSFDLFTPEQIAFWANENIGSIGFWQIVTNPGSFNDDFSEDFELYLQLLVIYTSQATSVTITITTIPQ